MSNKENLLHIKNLVFEINLKKNNLKIFKGRAHRWIVKKHAIYNLIALSGHTMNKKSSVFSRVNSVCDIE